MPDLKKAINEMENYAELDAELLELHIGDRQQLPIDGQQAFDELDEEFSDFQRGYRGFNITDDDVDYYGELDYEMAMQDPVTEYIVPDFADDDSAGAIGFLKEGLEHFNKMQYEEAARSWLKGLDEELTEPLYKILNEQLEICYRRLGEYTKAEEAILRLEALNPSFQILNDLVVLHEKSGNKRKLLEIRNRIKEYPSKHEGVRLRMSDLLVRVKDYQGAAEIIKDLLKSKPDDIFLNRKLFVIYISEENWTEALNFETEMTERGNEDDYLFQMSTLHRNMINLERANYYAKKYFEKNNRFTDASYSANLATALVMAAYDDELFDEEEYVSKMRELYYMKQPPEVNKFDIDTGYFRDLRVGFISYDFSVHPVGYFSLALFRDGRKESGIRTYCYYTRPNIHDGITKQIHEQTDVFRNVSTLSDQEIAKIILADGLDILIELSGNTVGHKLDMLAKRLAPIQITWMGFPISTFTPNIDYLIGDHYTDTPGVTEKFLTEKVLRMPEVYMCYPLAFNEEIQELPAKRNGYVTFAGITNPAKLSNKTISMWGEILKRIPNSRLLLQNKIVSQPFMLKHLKKRLEENGVDVSRVIFERSRGFTDYLKSYNNMDIVLDTYPYNGVTTTCEGFFMGVPVISLRGQLRQSRCAYSLLTNAGLGDMAVDTEEAYIEKAVELAGDLERLSYLRSNLREDIFKTPVSDTASFRRELENNLRRVYVEYCSKNKKEFSMQYEEIEELVKAVIVGVDFMKSLIKDGDRMDTLKPLIDEWLIIADGLAAELEEEYADDETVLRYINGYVEVILLLRDVCDEKTADKLLSTALKFILSMV